MGEFSSITRTGKDEPFNLHVQRGYVQGHSNVHKFGYAVSVSTTEQTIWDGGQIYVYPTSATELGVVGTSAGANSEITIIGLDENYNEITNIVTLNGTTSVSTSASYLRVYRAFVSDDNDAGEVTIRHSGITVAKILEGENQTLMAVYTVPAGYTGYIDKIMVGTAATNGNRYITTKLKTREEGKVFRTKAKYTVADENHEKNYSFPLKVEEKTDIEIRGQASAGVQEASAMFDILLIKNENV